MQKPLIPALLLLLLASFGCSKSDNLKVNDTWVVTYFSVNVAGQVNPGDNSALFSGYLFEFNDDDKMVVRLPDGNTLQGKWSITPPAASLAVENPSAPIDEIVGDWQVTEQTDTVLKLGGKIDATVSGVEISEIHFTKQ